jgi:hypothetical protein
MADELKFAIRCGGSTKKKANKNNNNNDIYIPFDTINLTSTPLNDLTASKSQLLSNTTTTTTTEPFIKKQKSLEITENENDYFIKKPELMIIENSSKQRNPTTTANLASNIPLTSKTYKDTDCIDVFNSHKKVQKKIKFDKNNNNAQKQHEQQSATYKLKTNKGGSSSLLNKTNFLNSSDLELNIKRDINSNDNNGQQELISLNNNKSYSQIYYHQK